MTKKKQKFYVVWKGRRTGVFRTWKECAAAVTGYADAVYKSYSTLAAAEEAYGAARESTTSRHENVGKPIWESYCVDAACAGNPGIMEYRCVHTKTRKEVFRGGPFEDGTNNVGEFLAIVHALALFTKKGIDLPIYTDSRNAISWVLSKKCKTKLAKTERNVPLFDLIGRAEKWLAENEYTNEILKWQTEAWGEIPADFGRK